MANNPNDPLQSEVDLIAELEGSQRNTAQDEVFNPDKHVPMDDPKDSIRLIGERVLPALT